MSGRATALHESGHLAAGIIHGATIDPEGANIRQGHWRDGEAAVYVPIDPDALQDAWWRCIGGFQVDPLLRDAVERDCYVLLAGGITEAVAEQRGLIGPRPVIDHAAPEHRPRYIAAITSGEPRPKTDGEQVDALLRMLTESADELVAYRTVLHLRTERMVRSHPDFWPFVEALSLDLIENESLSGDRIAEIAADILKEDTDAH